MNTEEKIRRLLRIRGLVQGVGFRPFVYRLAHHLDLKGRVENSPQGVLMDVEGTPTKIQKLCAVLREDLPAPGRVQEIKEEQLAWKGFSSFEIRPSSEEGKIEALILPDIGTCEKCLEEVFDKSNRRYRYPFTNCTHCGPRFTIIQSLPYDRGSTTMKKFTMCPSCQEEYDNPLDRRFHAQPNACPECGPKVSFWNVRGEELAREADALQKSVLNLKDGKILAVKGLGGFHLMVDATNEEAILRLRKRKCREEKALALMVPNMEWAHRISNLRSSEEDLLQSFQAPITLVEKKKDVLPEAIAPDNAFLGIMLPYTPLHHILLKDLDRPLVATSGNRKDEPICFDENEAVSRLSNIADAFLIHDRPIQRYVDDSIARIMAGRTVLIRRARGYAPLPVAQVKGMPDGIVGLGAHLKSTIAFSKGESIFLSHHIGDLETDAAISGFDQVLEDFPNLYELEIKETVRDLHPDYYSSQKADQYNLPRHEVQHHEAHVYAGMLENNLRDDVLAFSWDGTGLGPDRKIWGGEVFLVKDGQLKRCASLREFTLIGGDRASREPRRSALGLLYEAFGNSVFEKSYLPTLRSFQREEFETLRSILEKGQMGVRSSSMGRFFDGVASILGVRQSCSYEAQAAIQLEQLALEDSDESFYTFKLTLEENPIRINWESLLLDLIADQAKKTSPARMARRFHNTLAEIILELTQIHQPRDVLLTGGCFQNRLLTEQALQRLETDGFSGHIHQMIPANDGGISVGQVASLSFMPSKT